MDRDKSPDIYEWHVLPFGTVSSPCCAIYAVQRDVRDHQGSNEDLLETVTTSFYVDNCLKSLRSPQQAKNLLDRLRALLAKATADNDSSVRQIHIFCDASEKAYGSVAYLRVKGPEGRITVSFIMARSRVAPKRQQTMPRLELCAALTGAQLAKLLQTELTLSIQSVVLWSDSTTVLSWIQSESNQYKVFVGTRVTEILALTTPGSWRYINTDLNPADDLTRGKSLLELSQPSRWSQGPSFLYQSPDYWPVNPSVHTEESDELRARTFRVYISTTSSDEPDPAKNSTWTELLQATYQSLYGAAGLAMSAADRIEMETTLLRRIQSDSFPDELKALKQGKPVRSGSRLSALSAEYDQVLGLIRVGGRLRKAESLLGDSLHPVVISPDHLITQLLVKDYDHRLHHAGPERIFAEIRRNYWILRGRQVIKKHQRHCVECRLWRSTPVAPMMADLPAARLRINKPPFWSTGVDCFGPYTVKIGRRHEKRWGIIFKCLDSRCVHLDLLPHMDTDSFLLALRRFISRRGKPYEILCDRGTNFRGGERELKESLEDLNPPLKQQLADQSITFKFNPPLSPHFGGAWEREVKSVKASLQVMLRDQVVSEEVLSTVLVEVEGILNSKPLGYSSSDLADPDPVTPNLLLMGRRDASLPQAAYGSSELLGRRRWRHSQVLADWFWSQFTRQYLPNLQRRQKWRTPTFNLAVDQVVMVVDSQLPRALWPIGKVTKVHPSDDGTVRSADIDIKGAVYTRPVTKLVLLPKMPEDDTDIRVLYNNKGYHSMPTYLNVLNNAILRANLPSSRGNPAAYGITLTNHPMNRTSASLSLDYLLQGTDVVIAIFIIVAMSFVPASFVVFLVAEKSTKAKHLQFVSGCDPVIYWLANYIWDMLNYLVPATCCVIILFVFDLPAYTSPTNFPAVLSLFLLYGWSITPIMYPASFWFEVPSTAYVFLIVINLFIGITATVATFLLQLFEHDKDLKKVNSYLKSCFLIFPNYNLGHGLMEMAYNEYINEYYAKIGQFDKMKSPFEWDIVTRGLVAMTIEGFVGFLITILCQYNFLRKPPRVPVSCQPIDDDVDVARERRRVLRGDADNDMLKIENLTKV
ncbi:ATP-binding cassette sub-family A member 2 [Collichthys lucidus]|uniref:ATP-binding cassette sub-family A member 2 n=1 Tax=Collichthys lucidus TaxID=240159 RepID=A0A4U5TUJ4_COLLU|nr:ATP-binding cassette sub-family A member 2 [Collichthys lucidus]